MSDYSVEIVEQDITVEVTAQTPLAVVIEPTVATVVELQTGGPGPKGDQGDTGDIGPQGNQGDKGDQGDPGPNTVSTSTTTNITGLLKGDGSVVSQAQADTDYATPSGVTTAIASKQNGPLSGVVTTPSATNPATSITNNAITNAMLRQGAALSVIGRATNTLGNVADIAAATANHVLRRVGTTLGFGFLDVASITTGIFAIARGGTNSGSVLVNDRIIRSESGAIKESDILYSDLTGLSSNVQSQINGKPNYIDLPRDLSYHRNFNAGINNIPKNQRLYGPHITAGPYTEALSIDDTTFLYPFVAARGFRLSAIVFEITQGTGPGTGARGLLCASTPESGMPSELLVFGDGIKDNTVGVHAYSIENEYAPGLYWVGLFDPRADATFRAAKQDYCYSPYIMGLRRETMDIISHYQYRGFTDSTSVGAVIDPRDLNAVSGPFPCAFLQLRD